MSVALLFSWRKIPPWELSAQGNKEQRRFPEPRSTLGLLRTLNGLVI